MLRLLLLLLLPRIAAAHNPAFSLSLHTAEETVGFCQVEQGGGGGAPSAFASASLGDCGLSQVLLLLPILLALLLQEVLDTFTSVEGGEVVRDLTWSRGDGWIVNSETKIKD